MFLQEKVNNWAFFLIHREWPRSWPTVEWEFSYRRKRIDEGGTRSMDQTKTKGAHSGITGAILRDR